jgi:hypothetical protein
LFDPCAADFTCATAFPGLEAHFYELIAALNANPRTYLAIHPRTGIMHQVSLTGNRRIRNLHQALYHCGI